MPSICKIFSLTLSDLPPALLDTFERRQVVQNAWRKVDGKWAIIPAPFVDDWSAQERRNIVQNLRHIIEDGGAVFGALQQGKLLAFAAMSGKLLGEEKQYADLLELHTDNRYRRMGLGRALFERCAAWARKKGAQKLYISAHSAEESQAFYRSLGCVDAIWISREHVSQEPFDCQLEYSLL